MLKISKKVVFFISFCVFVGLYSGKSTDINSKISREALKELLVSDDGNYFARNKTLDKFKSLAFLRDLRRRIKTDLVKYKNYERELFPEAGSVDSIQELEKKIKELGSQISSESTDSDIEDIKKQKEELQEKLDIKNGGIKDLQNDIKIYENFLKTINKNLEGVGNGDIFFRGIAGEKNMKMIEDMPVGDNVIEGIKSGILLRGAISIGDSIGKGIDGYTDRFFKLFFGSVEKSVVWLYRLTFHSSAKPFTTEELVCWQNLIGNDFGEVCKMLLKSQQNDLKSKEEIKREYGTDVTEKEATNLWQDFVEDTAQTCQDLVDEINCRKKYYDKKDLGFGIITCSNRLCNKLLKIRDWLLKVKSLKDFTNLSEVKSIAPAMKVSLDFYFKNLIAQIEPDNNKKDVLSSNNTNNYNNYSNKWGKPDDYEAGPFLQ